MREADLLVHVVDISHPQFEEQIAVVRQTLQEIGAGDKPVYLVFNKVDAYTWVEKDPDDLTPPTRENRTLDELKQSWIARENTPCIFLSALTKLNLEKFRTDLYGMVREIHAGRYPSTTSSTDTPTAQARYDTAHPFPAEHRSEQVHRPNPRPFDSAGFDAFPPQHGAHRRDHGLRDLARNDLPSANVETPLGEATVELIDERIVVATILRAGLPYHQGFLNYFDDAQNAFVSAYRKKSTKDGKFTVKVEYISCGSLEGKTLLLVDPMLATGSSLVLTYEALCAKGGTPAHTHVASVIASEQGVEYAMKHMPRETTTIWVAAVDEELTSRSYIVPGIGDAGDLATWREALIRMLRRKIAFPLAVFAATGGSWAPAEAALHGVVRRRGGPPRRAPGGGAGSRCWDTVSLDDLTVAGRYRRAAACRAPLAVGAPAPASARAADGLFRPRGAADGRGLRRGPGPLRTLGFRIDATVLIYLADPKEAMASVDWWLGVRQTLIAALCTAGILWLYRRTLRLFDGEPLGVRSAAPATLLFVMLAAFDFLAIRGGTGASVANVSKVCFSSEAFLNHAATNPLFSLLSSLGDNEDYAAAYPFYDTETLDAHFCRPAGRRPAQRPDTLLLTTRRPNVVVVILESFARTVMDEQVGGEPVMPSMQRLKGEGLWFENFFCQLLPHGPRRGGHPERLPRADAHLDHETPGQEPHAALDCAVARGRRLCHELRLRRRPELHEPGSTCTPRGGRNSSGSGTCALPAPTPRTGAGTTR